MTAWRDRWPPGLRVPVLLLGLAACGGSDGTGRWAVATREPRWRAAEEDAPARAPLTTTWILGAGSADGAILEGGVTLSNERTAAWRLDTAEDGAQTLTGPSGFGVVPEVYHSLVLRLRAPHAGEMSVAWRAAGQAFSADRRLDGLPVEADIALRSYVVRLASMKGQEGASHARDGVEAFRVALRGADGAALQAELHSVALVSEFDDPDGRPWAAARLRAREVYRNGVALRAPGRLGAQLAVQEGDQLRFGLSAAGSTATLAVTVRAGSVTRRFACEPGAAWIDADIDLDDLEGETAGTVWFEVSGPEGEPAVLQLGSVMQLRREATPRPDVLLYIEDTLRPDRLSLYGSPLETDPHLRRVAAAGTLFERAYSPSNWTRPAVSSLMTSLVPSAHGNQTHRRRIPDGLQTLAETLAEAGWVTVSFVSNQHAAAWSGLDQGYDIHHEPPAFGSDCSENTLSSACIHPLLEALLEAYQGVRLFVMVHSLDPHSPYEPLLEDLVTVLGGPARPPVQSIDPARALKDGRNYDAEILHNDRWLSLLDETLSRLGRLQDTLFVFTSDHGEQFGEHGFWEHHYTLYDEEVRVPLLFRWPGHVPAGVRRTEAVSLLDVAPTLAGLLQVPVPGPWQGRDLSGMLTAQGMPARPAPILIEAVAHESHPHPGHELAVVLEPHKLILRVEDGALAPTELYDLGADPSERVNLLGEESLARLVGELTAFAQQALEAGELIRDEDTTAFMDPSQREFMRQMGYLR